MAAPQSVRDGSDTAQPTRPGTASGSGQWCSTHRLRVVGYVQRGRIARLDCDKPLHVVCRDCDFVTRWACSGHRESRCRPCAARYRRRVRTVASSGTGRAAGFEYFLTVTAPGAQRHRVGRSGEWCPCTPEGGVDLAAWNASHSRRWNHFRTLLRRELSPDAEYFRGVEVQQRGALHDHSMLWSPVALRVSRVRELAVRAGFGHSVDLVECRPGSKKAAYYVSKYVTKSTDQRHDVPWLPEGTADTGEHLVDVGTGEILRRSPMGYGAPYRTWSMSRRWGLTMAAVKADARAYAAGRREAEAAAGEALVLASFDCRILPSDETPPAPS